MSTTPALPRLPPGWTSRRARCAPAVRGLSLIELLVSVALLGVLAALAAPSVGNFIAARRVDDIARRLAETMSWARSEAVKRNASVLLCPNASVTDGSCATAAQASDWSKGWRVCTDVDNDGSCGAASSSNPNPIRVQSAITTGVALSGPLARLRFNPDGTITAAAYSAFSVSSSTGKTPGWKVQFAASGALSTGKL